MSKKHIFPILLAICAALYPVLSDDRYIMNILIMILLYATIASGWNILGGYGGQLSLGHALFFGLGAYTSTLLYLNFGLSPWVGMIIAVIVCIIAGMLIGIPTFKLRGPYFTLGTIAFAEVIRHVTLYWRDLTNGSMGLNIKYEPSFAAMIFKEYEYYYWLILGLLVLTTLLVHWIDRNKMGYYLKAIREDEDAAETLGINTSKYKMLAMMISTGITGLAGVFYAQFNLFFEPESVFHMNISTEIALIAIIGGAGTVYGPILGAFIIIPLNEILRASFPDIHGMNYFVYGILLIVIVILTPNGLLPIITKWWDKIFRKKVSKTKGVTKYDLESQ
ncbi:branched-chain amino acid ABC transporter permease [Psychrobacillus soli]|uniref:Branched-chain amino acid ABC transporter permease n=1 Tax=Psychrobacillus soli TaxID=1543965 RepID=A0A544TLA2_9BACI|nr:branched-chain amino acid ABC transporter permease [Psychrobacillus soli]TQR18234.1 branched-chain amino acid ABC transporter permease [Psychrobacillus soli]